MSKKRKDKKSKTDAVLVKVAEDKIFSKMLKIDVKRMWQTKTGDLLIEMKADPAHRTSFATAVKGKVGDTLVRRLTMTTTIEARGIDEETKRKT